MKIKKIFTNIEEIISATLFIAIFLILIAQIVFRQIFNSPLIWSEELALLLYVWVGILGVSIGVKYEQHVLIDFIYNKLNSKTKKIVFTFIQFIVLISILTLILIGVKLFSRKMIFELTALKISAGWMYIALPTISTLMLFRFFEVSRKNYLDGQFIFSPKKTIEKDNNNNNIVGGE